MERAEPQATVAPAKTRRRKRRKKHKPVETSAGVVKQEPEEPRQESAGEPVGSPAGVVDAAPTWGASILRAPRRPPTSSSPSCTLSTSPAPGSRGGAQPSSLAPAQSSTAGNEVVGSPARREIKKKMAAAAVSAAPGVMLPQRLWLVYVSKRPWGRLR